MQCLKQSDQFAQMPRNEGACMHACTQPTDTLPAPTVCQVLLDAGMGYQGARQTMSLSQDVLMLVERGRSGNPKRP